MTDLLFPVFRPSSEAETRENEFLIDYLALVCFFVMMLGLGEQILQISWVGGGLSLLLDPR